MLDVRKETMRTRTFFQNIKYIKYYKNFVHRYNKEKIKTSIPLPSTLIHYTFTTNHGVFFQNSIHTYKMSNVRCYYCGDMGHYANFCPQIKGSNAGVPVEAFYSEQKFTKEKNAYFGNLNSKNVKYKSPK
jgi:hypothetical protein